jgi:hypothetical protein
MIATHGRKRINWVTWDKYNEAGDLQGFMDGYTLIECVQQFQVMAEYLVWHAGEDWEQIRAYLDAERRRAGFTYEMVRQVVGCAPNSGLPSHWFTRSQWMLPTQENYEKLQRAFNRDNGNEYLRREYEDLRYTFNNPGKVSSVWQIPPAPKNGHPTPKPEELLERVIETTSDPGDLVLDFFAGSFTTAVVAERLDRRWICCDNDTEWVELGQRRISQPQQTNLFAGPER